MVATNANDPLVLNNTKELYNTHDADVRFQS
jgi:hypothetical protein